MTISISFHTDGKLRCSRYSPSNNNCLAIEVQDKEIVLFGLTKEQAVSIFDALCDDGTVLLTADGERLRPTDDGFDHAYFTMHDRPAPQVEEAA